MKREKLAAIFFAAALVLGLAASAGAVDGVIEINQAKVLAAGGFPYVVANPGSYRLTSNLTVSSINTDAINVTTGAGRVTIDLNGFSITGPGVTTGLGIFGPSGLTIENGTVTGFSSGIVIENSSIVRSIHSAENSTNGIQTGASSVIQDSTVTGNTGGAGLIVGGWSVISGNTVNFNGVGINCTASECLVSGNTIVGNATHAMSFTDATSGYGGNILDGSVVGGTSMGAKNTNLCLGTAC
jgi:hypothetical protein